MVTSRDILVARSSTRHSPPLIEILATTVVSFAIQKVWDISRRDLLPYLKAWLAKETILDKEHRDLLDDLFGFIRNASLIVGKRYPGADNSVCEDDVQAVLSIAGFIPLTLAAKPEIRETMDSDINFNGNICSIGSPITSQFSGWMMGFPFELHSEMEPDFIPDLPYTINYQVEDRCKGKTIDRIRDMDDPLPNRSIKDTQTDEDIYIPTYDPNTMTYTKDYLLVIKTRSIHAEGRAHGYKNLVVAGCHRSGTRAIELVLKDKDMLQRIFDEVGDDDFEAVISVDVEKTEPKRVKLLNVQSVT